MAWISIGPDPAGAVWGLAPRMRLTADAQGNPLLAISDAYGCAVLAWNGGSFVTTPSTTGPAWIHALLPDGSVAVSRLNAATSNFELGVERFAAGTVTAVGSRIAPAFALDAADLAHSGSGHYLLAFIDIAPVTAQRRIQVMSVPAMTLVGNAFITARDWGARPRLLWNTQQELHLVTVEAISPGTQPSYAIRPYVLSIGSWHPLPPLITPGSPWTIADFDVAFDGKDLIACYSQDGSPNYRNGYFWRLHNGAWALEGVSPSSLSTSQCPFIVDAAGKVNLVYKNYITGELTFASEAPGGTAWPRSTVANAATYDMAIAIGGNGKPIVAWSEALQGSDPDFGRYRYVHVVRQGRSKRPRPWFKI